MHSRFIKKDNRKSIYDSPFVKFISPERLKADLSRIKEVYKDDDIDKKIDSINKIQHKG